MEHLIIDDVLDLVKWHVQVSKLFLIDISPISLASW